MKKVYHNYAKGLGMTICIGIFALIIACLVNHYFVEINTKFIRLISGSAGTVALFGRLGWNIQTWSGNSPEEVLNNRLYKILYGLGYFLLVISLFI